MGEAVLLLGRKGFVLEDVQKELEVDGVRLLAGTSIEDVRNAFEKEAVDIVIMGAGLPLEVRLQIVEHIFEVSESTTVHMKDWDSGPQGMLPFVNGILRGLAG